MKGFTDRLIKETLNRRSYLSVGLDPQLRYFPPQILKYFAKKYGPGYKASAEAIIAFNRTIIDVTNPYALCFKPQMAFYEKYGHQAVRRSIGKLPWE